jgi:hypothetical protein
MYFLGAGSAGDFEVGSGFRFFEISAAMIEAKSMASDCD